MAGEGRGVVEGAAQLLLPLVDGLVDTLVLLALQELLAHAGNLATHVYFTKIGLSVLRNLRLVSYDVFKGQRGRELFECVYIAKGSLSTIFQRVNTMKLALKQLLMFR